MPQVKNLEYTLPNGQTGVYSGDAASAPGQPGSFAPNATVKPPVTPQVQTSTPSVLSSATGAEIVGQQASKLSQLSSNPNTQTPAPQGGTSDAIRYKLAPDGKSYIADKSSTATPSAPTKITLINPDTEQTLTFENADLDKSSIQGYLDSGYQVSEASGTIPSWLQPNGVGDNSETAKAQAAADTAAADLKSLTDNLTKFTISDADLQAQISGITSLWDSRIADMQRVNKSRTGSINTLGVRLGSRFGGGSGGAFGGIVSEEERQGIIRIGDLEGQKQAAIAAAKSAAMSQNWSVYSKQVDIAERAYEQKVKEVENLQKATAEQNKLIAQAVKDEEKAQYDQVTKPINDVLLSAAKNGAPQEIQDAISSAVDVGTAIAAAREYLQDVPTSGIVGEFLFYEKRAKAAGLAPMDFNQYQTVDANRRKSIAAAGVANDSGLNPKQVTIFNGIVDKQNKSPLIAANDRAVVLRDVAASLKADPKNAALQVSFIYSMIQALDTYQSAVREGEIGLLSSTQGLGDKISNLPDKIMAGTPLSTNKVNEYLGVARLLTDSINSAAEKKRQGFAAQAKVAGVGGAFDEYQAAVSNINTNPLKPEQDAQAAVDAAVKENVELQKKVYNLLSQPTPSLGRPMNYQEIQQYLQATGALK